KSRHTPVSILRARADLRPGEKPDRDHREKNGRHPLVHLKTSTVHSRAIIGGISDPGNSNLLFLVDRLTTVVVESALLVVINQVRPRRNRGAEKGDQAYQV